MTDAECKVAYETLGYTGFYQRGLHSTFYTKGCSNSGRNVFWNSHPLGGDCGTDNMSCICANNLGSPEDKVCIDVRKKRACKALEYCNYDRKASPRCTDKDPSVKIPIKEFCEIIHVRGWCRSVDACLWTGKQCMLRSEAVCADLEKRRRCNYFKSHKGNCLNGNYCQVGVTAATCINGGSC